MSPLFLLVVHLAGQNPAWDTPRPDVILHWNEVALQAVKADNTPPPKVARNLGMLHGAMYDAVNAVYRTHQPYRVNAQLGGPASPEAAAAVAAHRILSSLYPRQLTRFDTALDADLAGIPEDAARTRGITLGQRVADLMLTWRATDGMQRRMEYTPGTAPGDWQPTPPGFQAGLLPQWCMLRPFVMDRPQRFRASRPPALNSEAYQAAFVEVRDLGALHGSRRTAEQTTIARFWDDGAGTVTPPGHWNRIAQTVARQRGLSLPQNARLFALLNLSLADAAIVAWDNKFHYSYWRPLTAIRRADLDGNPHTQPDPGWTPLLTTPPFPSYTSGHSTFSGAAASALANFFGTDEIAFTTRSDGLPDVARGFSRFSAAANEAGRSRIYGGIHWEFDNQEGLATGRALGDYVSRHILQPRPGVTVQSSASMPRE